MIRSAIVLFVPFMTLLAQALPSVSADAPYTIEHEEGEHLDIVRPDGQPILRYMYSRDTSDEQRTFDTAKIFAHVLAPGGETTLTKGPGGKFPHHRGIFIGWSKLKHGGKSHDLWHVRNTAQEHRSFEQQDAGNGGGKVVANIDWLGTDGKPVVKELRTYAVTDTDDAYALIDLTSELTAVGSDVVLDGDPEHAGVQFRPSQKVAENKSAGYTFHREGINPNQDLDLPWVAETFQLDGQKWTVQHMSHPQNPEGARWSAYRDYGRFGPFTVIEIPEGETQTLNYRFRITKGDTPSRETLAEQYSSYKHVK